MKISKIRLSFWVRYRSRWYLIVFSYYGYCRISADRVSRGGSRLRVRVLGLRVENFKLEHKKRTMIPNQQDERSREIRPLSSLNPYLSLFTTKYPLLLCRVVPIHQTSTTTYPSPCPVTSLLLSWIHMNCLSGETNCGLRRWDTSN